MSNSMMKHWMMKDCQMSNKLKEDRDWKLIPDPTKEDTFHWCVEILVGKYKGVVFRFDRVQFAEKENEDGFLPFRFDHTRILDPVGIDTMHETKVTDYLSYISDILLELLYNHAEEFRTGTERQEMIDNYKNSKKSHRNANK